MADDTHTSQAWQPRGRNFDTHRHRDALLAIFAAVRRSDAWTHAAMMRILAQHPRDSKGYFSKIELVTAYQQLTASGELPFEQWMLRRLQMKPIRTSSGVAPVTVLTEPAGCPGRCIFCPDAAGMPKSYLPNEPGARRAAQCGFDPYLQVRTRLDTFEAMGHTADKVELLILGGTWSAYARPYREWFVQRCLDALNAAPDRADLTRHEPAPPNADLDRAPDSRLQPSDLEYGREASVILSGSTAQSTSRSAYSEESPRRDEPAEASTPDMIGQAPPSASLAEAQARNETARHRNVGLVIETRPDWVTPDEVRHLRQLGVTKVQLGVQSLDDGILALNQRGHDVAAIRQAVTLLAAAGFKLVLHWMPNLLGATPASDRADFARLWSDPALRPDEIKIYPCSIIEGTKLYDLWRAGAYRPYTDDELIDLVADCKATIPPYCRVNRVFRDIPAGDIVAGSKRSNLRQLVRERMAERGQVCNCIRCREVRGEPVGGAALRLVVHAYETAGRLEQFLSYETAGGQLAGFLRLALPRHETFEVSETSKVWDAETSKVRELLPELRGAAMIRELHVYGPALGIGAENAGEAQHLGLGRRLVAEARARAAAAGFDRLAVISAIGTRRYYERLGFERGELYLTATCPGKPDLETS